MNTFKLHIFFFFILMSISPVKPEVNDNSNKTKSYFDQNLKHVVCKEPIPLFTLNYNSNPTNDQVSYLCSCIWNKFPQGRWEREEMIRLSNGGKPNWKTNAMYSRFAKKMKECGGYEL